MKAQATGSRNNERKTLRLRDVVIAAVLIVLSAAAYLFLGKRDSGAGAAEVYANGDVIAKIDLSEDGVYPISGFDMELTVKDGKICVSHSDCPDKVCERTGYISSSYQSIVCLPNRIAVKIVSSEKSDNIDVVI